jgi:hypothetical protein
MSGPLITVAQVRACSSGDGEAHSAQETADIQAHERADDERAYASKAARDEQVSGPMWPGSPKQIAYVIGLQKERQLPDNHVVKDEEALKLMERDKISAEINLLKTYPRKQGRADDPTTYTMAEGRYALYMEAGPGVGTGSWHFYQVDKPTKGRWDGYVFIKRLIGAPGTYQKVAVAAADRHRLLDRIEHDPKKAMIDYGKESGVCGRCASPLSDPDSLARGIGPKCAAKSGWF